MRALTALMMMTQLAWAEGETSGEFDYYVLSLSWSPNWCALEGDDRQAKECADGTGFGWTLHGLWPQYARGWPSYCHSEFRDPTRADTAAMADIMGSSGSAWHQWKKHGRCSGLSPTDYFEAARRAYASVARPEVFRKLTRPVTLPARVVEEGFLKANPEKTADMITITCKSGRIQEARICLNRDLTHRICAPDVARDCAMSDALFDPIR